MSQIIHIFRKDARHFWKEIVVSVAILVAYTWKTMHRWLPPQYTEDIWFDVVSVLVPISWAFLVLQAVHDESLVGDRQPWVTRPYDWKKLLAAKLVFVLAFVCLPLFIADVILLLRAGFAPRAYLSGLLWLQLAWILALVLPALTLASITSGIRQALLVILVVILYFVGVAWLSSFLYASDRVPGTTPEWPASVIALAVAIAVILLQYARRRTLKSRLLVLAGAIALIGVDLLMPSRYFIDRAYPSSSAPPAPVQLVFEDRPALHKGHVFKDQVSIPIPIKVEGLDPRSIVKLQGVLATLESASGETWTSRWQMAGTVLFPARSQAQVALNIDKAFFDRAKRAGAGKLHLTFAVTVFDASQSVRVVPTESGFTLPGNGRCSILPTDAREVFCAFPLRRPFAIFSVASDEVTCPPDPDRPRVPQGRIGYGWFSWEPSGPAAFGLSPVKTQTLYASDWGDLDYEHIPPRICAGTPITVRLLKETRRTRLDMTAEGLRLSDYDIKDVRGGGRAFGVGLYRY